MLYPLSSLSIQQFAQSFELTARTYSRLRPTLGGVDCGYYEHRKTWSRGFFVSDTQPWRHLRTFFVFVLKNSRRQRGKSLENDRSCLRDLRQVGQRSDSNRGGHFLQPS